MASNQADDEMAEFQRRSDAYQPDLGNQPPIGPRQSTQALVAEFATADPIFVRKTNALTRTHPEYRVIKGDGMCGWRAIALGYFETLFNQRSVSKVQQEISRLNALNAVILSHQQNADLFDMFIEPVFELLDKIINSINAGVPDANFVVENVNESSDALVFYLKMLTATTMKTDPDAYEPFCQMPVDDYCGSFIMPMPPYIDQPGLQAVADGLLRPAGFALDVLYLDLSQSDECNTHHFVADGTGLPTIRLLYRPIIGHVNLTSTSGHYDVLYQALPTASYSVAQTMQPAEVHLAHQMPSYNPFYVDQGYNDVDPIAQFLPNYSIVPGIPHLSQQFMPDTVAYPNDSFNTEAYQQPAASFPPSETTSTQTSLPVSPVSPQDVPQQQQQPQLAIRLSRLTHEPMQTLPLQTAPFKNSQYNQAHYQNTEFQPAMWNAEEEYHKS